MDNGSTEGLWGIIKTEMYKMYEIYDKESLIEAIGNYINFYNYQRYQERYNSKAPMEIRMEAMNTVKPKQYPIAFNPRIAKYHELLNNLKPNQSNTNWVINFIYFVYPLDWDQITVTVFVFILVLLSIY